MLSDRLLPAIAALLHARYLESRRAYLAEHPEIAQWKRKRRGRNRPAPGVHDVAVQDEG